MLAIRGFLAFFPDEPNGERGAFWMDRELALEQVANRPELRRINPEFPLVCVVNPGVDYFESAVHFQNGMSSGKSGGVPSVFGADFFSAGFDPV